VLFNVDLGRATDTMGQRWFYDTMGTKYRSAQYWFPTVGGQCLHPLIVWWAVLYTLSMLARYEPQRWADMIRVNTSPWAVPLEHLLNAALDALPEVIFAGGCPGPSGLRILIGSSLERTGSRAREIPEIHS
jgi:hypothetical protein